MGVLVLLLGLLSFLQSLKSLEVYSDYPHLIRLDWGGGLLIAPMIYYYVRFMTRQQTRWRIKDIGAFFPYIAHLVIISPFLWRNGESKIQVLDYYTATLSAGTDSYHMYYKLLVVFTALVGLHYCWESIKALKVYRSNIKSEFSALTKRELQWLNYFVWAFSGLFIILVGVYVLYTRDRYASFDYEVYFYLASFLLIYAITYSAINQQQVEAVIAPVMVNSRPDEKVKKLVDYAPLKERLQRLMQSEKPYLESDLTATQLADRLDISRHQLSELLSQSLETNFYDLVNQYRVGEFITRLKSGEAERLTLLAIAYDVGFNSKTAFNTAFKRMKGLTPSQYKKNLRQK